MARGLSLAGGRRIGGGRPGERVPEEQGWSHTVSVTAQGWNSAGWLFSPIAPAPPAQPARLRDPLSAASRVRVVEAPRWRPARCRRPRSRRGPGRQPPRRGADGGDGDQVPEATEASAGRSSSDDRRRQVAAATEREASVDHFHVVLRRCVALPSGRIGTTTSIDRSNLCDSLFRRTPSASPRRDEPPRRRVVVGAPRSSARLRVSLRGRHGRTPNQRAETSSPTLPRIERQPHPLPDGWAWAGAGWPLCWPP